MSCWVHSFSLNSRKMDCASTGINVSSAPVLNTNWIVRRNGRHIRHARPMCQRPDTQLTSTSRHFEDRRLDAAWSPITKK